MREVSPRDHDVASRARGRGRRAGRRARLRLVPLGRGPCARDARAASRPRLSASASSSSPRTPTTSRWRRAASSRRRGPPAARCAWWSSRRATHTSGPPPASAGAGPPPRAFRELGASTGTSESDGCAGEPRRAGRRTGSSSAYPDGSLNSLLGPRLGLRPAAPRSERVHLVPLPFAYHPDAPFCGASIVKDLKSIVAAFRPRRRRLSGRERPPPRPLGRQRLVDYALEGPRGTAGADTPTSRTRGTIRSRGRTCPRPTFGLPGAAGSVGTLLALREALRRDGDAQAHRRSVSTTPRCRSRDADVPAVVRAPQRARSARSYRRPSASSTTDAVPSGNGATAGDHRAHLRAGSVDSSDDAPP